MTPAQCEITHVFSSYRSESPMSDRYCGKCSSLLSLHLRTIESDGEFTRTASTQTRPQSKGKSKLARRPNSKKSSRCSLLENAASKIASISAASNTASISTATGPGTHYEASPRRLKRSHPALRSTSFLPTISRTTAFESSSSNESLHSST